MREQYLEKHNSLWGSVMAAWAAIIAVIIICCVFIPKLADKIIEQIQSNTDLKSASPVNIQIITGFKNTPYEDYIQSAYIHPQKTNKLIVIIKPTYWNILTKKQKQELMAKIQDNWQDIYKKNNLNSKLKPEAQFANME